ncbi:MAG TPA: universal stress protein [Thermoanaerobaculia bacterium]|nr:universal stress protein [Thermoanaerobaculia bacterium]
MTEASSAARLQALGPLRAVVAGTALDEASDAVVSTALATARAAGARLFLLHVVELPPVAPVEGTRIDDLVHQMQADGRARLDEQVHRLGARVEELAGTPRRHAADSPIPLVTAVAIGHAPTEILAAAAADVSDLIVMGTHGSSGYERFLLGSVTAAVVRQAPCNVLVVPPACAMGGAIAEAVLEQTALGRP